MDETASYSIFFNVEKNDPAVKYLRDRLDLYKWKTYVGDDEDPTKSILIIVPTLRALEIAAERFW